MWVPREPVANNLREAIYNIGWRPPEFEDEEESPSNDEEESLVINILDSGGIIEPRMRDIPKDERTVFMLSCKNKTEGKKESKGKGKGGLLALESQEGIDTLNELAAIGYITQETVDKILNASHEPKPKRRAHSQDTKLKIKKL